MVSNVIDAKLAREAESKDLELLGKVKNPAYRLYRFKKCRHQRELQTTNVRRGNVACLECLNIKLTEEASKVGLTLTGSGGHYSRRVYVKNDCGHKLELKTAHVRINNFRCKKCLIEKHKKEAEENGIKLIGEIKGSKNRLYEMQCGHEKSILPTHVRDGIFKCQQCYDDKLTSSLYVIGAELVGKTGNGNCSIRFDSCGHTRAAKIDRVANGKVYCSECNNTYLHIKSNIYLIKITASDFQWLKLGYAKDNKDRFSRYGLPTGSEVELVLSKEFETGRIARLNEEAIHSSFSLNKINPVKMQKYHSKSGFTECYPIEMLETLKNAVFTAKNDSHNDRAERLVGRRR